MIPKPVKKVSLAEPVTDLRKVRIVESGEPLVDFIQLCENVVLSRGRFDYRRESLLRETAARMLCRAAKAVPAGYRLGVIEGWRAPMIQRRMYLAIWNRYKNRNPDWSDVRLRRTVNRFTAPLDPRVPPPHSTGGALDVFLVDDSGKDLDMSSPFNPIDTKCFSLEAPGLSDVARLHRRILKEAMLAGGFTNYPSEYWHWSYGDQGWAYRGGHPHAVYGPIVPPNWQPDPRDATDDPLVFRED